MAYVICIKYETASTTSRNESSMKTFQNSQCLLKFYFTYDTSINTNSAFTQFPSQLDMRRSQKRKNTKFSSKFPDPTKLLKHRLKKTLKILKDSYACVCFAWNSSVLCSQVIYIDRPRLGNAVNSINHLVAYEMTISGKRMVILFGSANHRRVEKEGKNPNTLRTAAVIQIRATFFGHEYRSLRWCESILMPVR